MHPNAVLGSVASWLVDDRLRVIWAGTPRAAAHVVLRLFGAVLRRVVRQAAAPELAPDIPAG